jgi:hypothetical protein
VKFVKLATTGGNKGFYPKGKYESYFKGELNSVTGAKKNSYQIFFLLQGLFSGDQNYLV